MTQCTTGNSCETSGNQNQQTSKDECNFAEDLLCLAKSAKHELLKEKIKKGLEAKIGKKLDKVAEVAVEAVIGCLNQKIAQKEACEEYRGNLFAALKG